MKLLKSLEFKSVVNKIMIPVQVKNEIKVEESRTNPKVKDIKSDIVDVLDDRSDTQENKTIPPTVMKIKKKPKPDEVLASASHTEDIYMHKVNENWEYKQRKFPQPGCHRS